MAKAEKNSVFSWEGVDRDGGHRNGVLDGPNSATVRALLRKQGIEPKRVRRQRNSGLKQQGLRSGKKIKSTDITFLFRQLEIMLQAGIPLVQALELISESRQEANWNQLINQIKDDIAGGNRLATALRQHPKHFSPLVCNMIDAGEQAGILEQMLDRVASYMEKSIKLQATVKKAMVYPAITFAVAILVTIAMLIFVVPSFEQTFASMGAPLPAATKAVLSASDFVVANWWLLFLLTIGPVVAIKQLIKHSPNASDMFDTIALKLPLFGDILQQVAISRFARLLSTTFAAGMPLLDALTLVANATGNAVYRKAILGISQQVVTGQPIHAAMQSTKVFPNFIIQMTSIGEESGSLDTMLGKAADYHEQQVEDQVTRLTTMLEPLVLVVLGVLVGGLLVSMYLPIFSIGNAI